jgi:hypothetical protein
MRYYDKWEIDTGTKSSIKSFRIHELVREYEKWSSKPDDPEEVDKWLSSCKFVS